MIDEFTLKNLSTSVSVLMSKKAGNSFMLETDGIDWGNAEATHSTHTNLIRTGDIITSTKINPRPFSVTGRVCCPHTVKEIQQLYGVATAAEVQEKRLKEINASKKILSQLVNPMDVLRVTCGSFILEGKPNGSVEFSKMWKENNEIYCKFTFSLHCEKPMFRYKAADIRPLRGIYNGFHFPLAIPKPNGMHFGRVTQYQLLAVKNAGDTTIGGVICIKATGTVENPSFTNVETQESITIGKTLEAGEVIRIDTTNRDITGSVDGENFTNYFAYWGFNNTWLQFPVGTTLFGYSADDETYLSMNVWIEMNEEFYSMEDQ